MKTAKVLLINAHHAQQRLNIYIKISATLSVLLLLLEEFALTFVKKVHIWMEESVNLAMLIAEYAVLQLSAQTAKELSSVIKANAYLDALPTLFALAQAAQTVIDHVLVVRAV